MHRVDISAAREAIGYSVADCTRIEPGADVVSAELRRIAAVLQVPTSTIRLA